MVNGDSSHLSLAVLILYTTTSTYGCKFGIFYSFVEGLDFWFQNHCYCKLSQTKGYLYCYSAHQHICYMNITTPLNNCFYSSFSFQTNLDQNLNIKQTNFGRGPKQRISQQSVHSELHCFIGQMDRHKEASSSSFVCNQVKKQIHKTSHNKDDTIGQVR
jgi:hypothetical protein